MDDDGIYGVSMVSKESMELQVWKSGSLEGKLRSQEAKLDSHGGQGHIHMSPLKSLLRIGKEALKEPRVNILLDRGTQCPLDVRLTSNRYGNPQTWAEFSRSTYWRPIYSIRGHFFDH